jgi:hypothetical protein
MLSLILQVWEYIKTNNLQSQEKKSVIHCDSNLEDLSGKKMMKNTEVSKMILTVWRYVIRILRMPIRLQRFNYSRIRNDVDYGCDLKTHAQRVSDVSARMGEVKTNQY